MERFSRFLRKNMTDAEQLLWKHLRLRQILRYKFRRQAPIGKYIVDFVCFEKKIIIELDGGQHNFEKQKDLSRDAWLRSQGFRILRFWNNDVMQNCGGVLQEVLKQIDPPPSLPHEGGGNKIISS